MTAAFHKSVGRFAPTWLAFTAITLFVASAPLAFKGPTLVLWNASASVPVGLYLVQPGAHLQRGELAVSELPTLVRQVASERKYLPLGVLLIKPVAATSGATVCREGDALFINDVWTANARAADSRGRPLPIWSGCRTLGRTDVFLANPQVEDSFDGRYFGPTSLTLVRGRAWPLLTFSKKVGL